MQLTVISTGSSGNSYLLESNGRKILLDLGAKWIEIQRAIDFAYGCVDFALVSHAHKDHSVAVQNAVRHSILCYGEHGYCCPLKERAWSNIERWGVLPFPVHHTNNDGSDCANQAFIIQKARQRLLYMTDWQACSFKLKRFRINHFVIAVNYSEIPEGENRDHVLHGHSSLETAKNFLLDNMTEDTRSIIACHLSDINADPEKIYRELVDIAPDGCLVDIAEKGKVFQL